jgi:dihydroorotate dehydrogenase
MESSKGIIAGFVGVGYRRLIKPILFLQDPEKVHDRTLKFAIFFGKVAPLRWFTRHIFCYSSPKLGQTIRGIQFSNPVGLAAGFDKNAQLTNIIPALGFGFIEVGSITAKANPGNAPPRLIRLKKSKAILVNYGLNNDGAIAISNRLRSKNFAIPVGTSIAKTNSKETRTDITGVADYAKGFKEFTDIGAYYTINVSCPNAYGGQPFHDGKRLDKLLKKLDRIKSNKPRFVKISPDLSHEEINDIIEVIKKHNVDGLICSNLTKKRDNPKILETDVPEWGGISGKAVEELANDLIAYVYKRTKGKYVIIGCGGIFSAEDAYKKIRTGASLVQLITGMIYEGPQLAGQINRGLVKLLEDDGFSNISEAVATDIKTK